MFSPLRNRFGIPGVISVIALVFAMLGGAYAASDDSGSGKATASAKKGPPGPRGKPGKPGPAGPQGPAGPAGAKGDKGDTGAAGSNGSNGAVGPTGPTGPTGKTGKDGKDGETGFTEVLPAGKTETGTWAAGIGIKGLPRFIPAPFAIPLEEPLGEAQVHYLKPSAPPLAGKCEGNPDNPTAEPGHFCVYASAENELENVLIVTVNETLGASTSGAIMQISGEGDSAFGYGSWAVTAEE